MEVAALGLVVGLGSLALNDQRAVAHGHLDVLGAETGDGERDAPPVRAGLLDVVGRVVGAGRARRGEESGQ